MLVENNTAKGIHLVDRSEIEAKKMVISGVDAEQTVLRFLEPDYVSPKIAKRVRNILHDRGLYIEGWVALHEPPRYKAQDYDPDVNLLFAKYLVPKDHDYIGSKYEAEAGVYGVSRDLLIGVAEQSLIDPSRAPDGKYIGAAEIIASPGRNLSGEEWLKVKEKLGEEIIRQWQLYAPNVTKDNLIRSYIHMPYEMAKEDITLIRGEGYMGDGIASQQGRFRPIPELSGHRMPMKNMYLASAATGGFGGVKGTPGHVCYKLIARDFGLRKIWEETGFSYW